MFREEQMDIQIGYWNERSVLVFTRYFESQFLHRPNATILLKYLPTDNWIILS